SCVTHVASAKRAPVATFIHPLGHVYPPPVTPLIVKFFHEQSRDRSVGCGWTNKSAHEEWWSMKGLAFCAAILFLVGNLFGQGQQPSPADPALYGPYPTNYKEIVMKWLEDQLID